MCAVQKYSVNESLKVGTDFSKGLRRLDVRRPSRPRVTMAVQWRKKIIRIISSLRNRNDMIFHIIPTYMLQLVQVRAARAVDEGESVGETEIMYRDNNIYIYSQRATRMGKTGRKEGKIGTIIVVSIIYVIMQEKREKIAFTCLTERMIIILQYYNIIRGRPARRRLPVAAGVGGAAVSRRRVKTRMAHRAGYHSSANDRRSSNTPNNIRVASITYYYTNDITVLIIIPT